MTTKQEAIIIQMFQDSLNSWDWESWNSASASEREEIVYEVNADLGVSADVDEVFDLFYDWSAGLTEQDFEN